MRAAKVITAITAAALLGAALAAADPVITPYLGANAISYGNSLPSDFELGGSGSASLSPHITAVGGAWYGLGHTYLRGTIGARVTATDADDPNFDISLGGQYNASSKPAIRPQEWDADATAGWRPYPNTMPNVTLIAQGAYGFTSENVYLMLGVRYALKPF